MPVTALVEEQIERVCPYASLIDVARRMVEADVGALAVGATDQVTAIVSERDVVRALAAGRDPATTTAADIANGSLVCCDIDANVGEVAVEMMEHYVRHVFVERDGRIVGMVSARDLLGAFASDAMDA